MKVLVTGAGSLLMHGIATSLAHRGHEVMCLQRRSVEFEPILNIQQMNGDIRDSDAITIGVKGCEAVIHGAARVGVVGSWADYRDVNIGGTTLLLDAAQHAGVTKFVHVSTPSVAHVGKSLVGEGAEPAVTGRKGAFYAESKALSEVHALSKNSPSFQVVALRPHLVWGPGDTQLVGRIVERARAGKLVMVGSGSALVDSTYIDNAVSAHVAALDALTPSAACAGRAYVIANGEPRTVSELVQGICMAAGVEFAPRRVPVSIARGVGSLVEKVWPKFKEGEPPITRFVAEQLSTAHWFDPRPARDELKWTPHISLDQGFALLQEWYLQNE